MITPSRPNMRYLGRDFFVAHTQAGFRRAVKQFNAKYASEDRFDPKARTYYARPARKVQGYPKSYPSLVHLTNEHVGSCYSFTAASCTPISRVRAAMLPWVFRFLESDRSERKDFT